MHFSIISLQKILGKEKDIKLANFAIIIPSFP